MKRAGKRYPLLVYTRMLDRWWPALFLIGAGTLALAWPFYQDVYVRLTAPWRWMGLAGAGALVVVAALVMLAFRKSAYVQPLADHFRLATPFLRMNVSYRRIQRTTTANMAILFPPRNLHGLQKDIAEPLLRRTAVVIELNALPIPASTLRLFLSRFFFKDKTPHLVILVDNWMGFSTELESLRTVGDLPEPAGKSASSILAKLPPR
jgi:hypothetical protein